MRRGQGFSALGCHLLTWASQTPGCKRGPHFLPKPTLQLQHPSPICCPALNLGGVPDLSFSSHYFQAFQGMCLLYLQNTDGTSHYLLLKDLLPAPFTCPVGPSYWTLHLRGTQSPY